MQELIRRRRRAGFVGRRDELAVFRDNFDVPPEDERHRFLFHIHGDAGVGKSSLVQELLQLAEERSAVTATVDDSVSSVPEAMAAISEQFGRQGRPLKALDRMLATYRQRRHEAESASAALIGQQESPAGPEGGALPAPLNPLSPPMPTPSSMIVAQAGLIGLGMLPAIGAFAGAADPAQIARGTDRLRAALSARFGKQEDVQLVLDPLQVLTPVLVSELERVATDTAPWIALFFDTYERTGPFLDTWLRDLMTSDRYGALPAHVVITLAGQGRLDPRCWADCADFVCDLPLAPFTESEARTLLTAKGVVDERVVQDVLRLSGRLPVLVSTLAENPPTDPDDAADPSVTAVEGFLRGEHDEVRRAAALACALPRRLDEDVFRVAVDEEGFRAVVDTDAAGLFGRLRALPFVSERGGRVQYHDVVRAPMLRLQRISSPQRWRERHTRLAEAFAGWRERAAEGQDPDELWAYEPWRELRLAETYHRLCAGPAPALPQALRDGIDACDEGAAAVRRWARTLAEAGEDSDAEVLRRWGQDCLEALTDERHEGQERHGRSDQSDQSTQSDQSDQSDQGDQGDQGGTIRVLGILLARGRLTPEARATALVVRGRDHRDADEFEAALADFTEALTLAPELARAHYGLGVTLARTGDVEGALTALDEAERLSPDTAWIIGERGETKRQFGRYEAALADLDRAVALDPSDAWALASRGQAKNQLGRYQEALADLDRAIELDQEYTWALIRRAGVRRALGDVEAALADLDRADRVSPDHAWIHGERGEILRLADRHDEALPAFDRAIAIRPDYDWAYASRGMSLHELGRHEEALADLDRAIELDQEYTWALIRRAGVRRALGDVDAALADLERARTIEPDNAWLLFQQGETLTLADRHDEAVTAFDRAIAIRPDYGRAYASRGMSLRELGRHEEALADLDRVVELDESDVWALVLRAVVRRGATGDTAGALADLERARTIEPDHAWLLSQYAETLRLIGRTAEAVSAFDRAVALAPDDGWAVGSRGQTHHALGQYDEAIADLDMAVRLLPETAWVLAERGEVHATVEQFEAAYRDLDRAIELDPQYRWALASRAHLHLSTGRPLRALADLDRCLALGHDPARTHVRRASVLLSLGRMPDALAALDTAEEAGADSTRALASRTEALRRSGRYDEARAVARRLLETEPCEGSFHLAMELALREGLESAAPLFRDAERLLLTDEEPPGPASPPSRTQAGELAVTACALGDWARADRLLDLFLATGSVYDELADAAAYLTELARCPRADTTRLAERLQRVTEVRDALKPDDDIADDIADDMADDIADEPS
ncbi:tetratricopeptide repeat protein [Streptomyces sp. NBC_00259]|uniref:tetratricopeptide repeat protein n=1 Tax=Streptomyces sp. NBC_00259 TaxID=2903643 RepID=UPI002E2A57CA|nr:tetratricopeptide repeat protein [Streptomyces sp. NBC_00259]